MPSFSRRCMRVRRGKVRTSLLMVIAALGVGVLCSSTVARLQLAAKPGTGAPQLVSIQQLPFDGEMCAWPSTAPADPVLMASLEQDPTTNLFAAMRQQGRGGGRSEEHTSELQSPCNLVCRLLLEKKKKTIEPSMI